MDKHEVIDELVKQADSIMAMSKKLKANIDKDSPIKTWHQVELVEPIDAMLEFVLMNFTVRPNCHATLSTRRRIHSGLEIAANFKNVDYDTVGPLIVYHVLEKAPVNITKTKNWEAFERRFIQVSNRASSND